MTEITESELDQYRELLLAKRVELERQNAATIDDRAAVTLDQQSVGRLSRMDAMQQQAMAKATHQRRNQEIARAKAALARIDEGKFGYCTDCGEEISPARLQHDPSLPWCLDCATSR